MNKKRLLLPLILMTLITALVPDAMAQEQKQEFEIHEPGEVSALIIDFLIFSSLIVGTYLGYSGAKIFGGLIGNAFKSIYLGLIIFTVQHIIEMLHHFNIDLMAWAGEEAHTLIHHTFTLLTFVLITIGFFWIKKAIKD